MVKISDKTDYSRFVRPGGEDEGIAEPGDVIVTPAGVAHSYEVLGDEPAHVVCIDSPTRPKPES